MPRVHRNQTSEANLLQCQDGLKSNNSGPSIYLVWPGYSLGSGCTQGRRKHSKKMGGGTSIQGHFIHEFVKNGGHVPHVPPVPTSSKVFRNRNELHRVVRADYGTELIRLSVQALAQRKSANHILTYSTKQKTSSAVYIITDELV